MKYSILGTNGFLSTAIAKFCNEKEFLLDLYGLEEPKGHLYNSFYKVNLMDTELNCASLLDSDIIVYAIGAGIQANLKEGFNLIYNLNVTAPVTICNKLKELGYKGVFVTFGSVFEMGKTTEERFFTEEDLLKSSSIAANDYTVSKRMLTRFVDSYEHEFKHWHFNIPTIYGAGENPQRLIPYVINSIRNNQKLHFTSGDQVRQYLHVSEVPRVLEMSLQENLSSGIYNIEGNETLTVKEIVYMILNFMGIDEIEPSFGTIQRSDVGMKFLALDGKKLRDIIGFKPNTRIIDVINGY